MPAALLALVIVGVVACGRGGEPEVAFTVPPKPGATLPTTVPRGAPVCNPPTVTPPPADKKPAVERPTGNAPDKLETKDLKVGDGAEAKPGDTVKMEYVGVLYKDGTEFDSSWKGAANPFSFALGKGEVIPGWDQGVPGMKVGGQRMLVVPASLAYGDKGSPPSIGPNEPLVFVVDLLQVCTPVSSASAPPLSSPGAATGQPIAPTGAATGQPSTPPTSTPSVPPTSTAGASGQQPEAPSTSAAANPSASSGPAPSSP